MKIPKILTAKTLHWGKLVNIALGFQILGSGFGNCDWHRQIMQVFVERGLSKDLGHLPIKFNSIWKFQQMVTAGTKSFSIPTIFCYLLMFGYMTPWGEKLRWSRSISLRSGLGLAWLLEKKRTEELPSNMGKLKNITLVKNYLYSWWFQTFIYVHPYLGKIPILTIFQLVWNHHLVIVFWYVVEWMLVWKRHVTATCGAMEPENPIYTYGTYMYTSYVYLYTSYVYLTRLPSNI